MYYTGLLQLLKGTTFQSLQAISCSLTLKPRKPTALCAPSCALIAVQLHAWSFANGGELISQPRCAGSMSAPAGVKRALKAAREALAAKEYKEALQHCKAALKEDRSCYEAYV